MLVRIVKMSFIEIKVEEFLNIFETMKFNIRGFEGCQLLELYKDKSDHTVFFTYSYWNTESDLEAYRQSELFKTVWNQTKVLFNKKPEAWSVDKVTSLN